MRMQLRLLVLLLLFALAFTNIATGFAQDATPEPQIVQMTSADGSTTLEADYWVLSADQTPASGAPTVVFIHQYGDRRAGGLPLVEPLLAAGYNVLLVDRRADKVDDIQTWLDWVRDQPGVRPNAISLLGPGVGGTLALIGCANDEQCVTAIALSPRLNGYGLPQTASTLVESALSEGLTTRSVLLIASERDFNSQAKDMIPFAEGEIGLRLYAGSDHASFLYSSYSEYADSVIQLIISWLNEHTPTVES